MTDLLLKRLPAASQPIASAPPDAEHQAVALDDSVPFGRTQIAQGDVVLDLVSELPTGLVALQPSGSVWWLMPPSDGRPLGSHSIDCSHSVRAYAPPGQPLPSHIVVDTVARVDHSPKEGEKHSHATVVLTQGVWRVLRQREFVPAENLRIVTRAAAD